MAEAKTKAERGLMDMTTGRPGKLIVAFTIPMLLGNVLQQLYNMVDSMVVGRFVGTSALAAVGTSFPIIFLIISVFFGIGTGATIMISQYFGAGDMQKVRDTRDTITIAIFVLSVPITIVGIALAEPLLRLIRVEEGETLEMAVLYMRIIFVGTVANFGYNINTGVLQGLGDSKRPLLFLGIATVLNIVLDFVFVVLFGWGVAGVAIATILAQLASFLFGIFYINKHYPELHLNPRKMRFDWALMKECLRLGIPAGINNVIFSLSSMLLQGLVNTSGTVYTAGYNAANKVDMFAFMPIQTFSNALTTFVGQNVGAAKPDRIKAGLTSSLKIALGVCLAMNLLALGLSDFWLGLFTHDAMVIEAGNAYLWRIMPCYLIFTVFILYNGVLRGAGEAMFPLYVSIFGSLLLRMAFAYILHYTAGPDSMYWCFGIGWAVGTVITLFYYYRGTWRKGMMERIASMQKTASADAREG